MTDRNHSPETTDQVSDRRRRLLKAAAAGAPLIATLQSGAAFAQASARNCIVENAGRDPAKQKGSPDNWVRKEVIRYKFEKPDGSITNWKYDIDGNHAAGGPYYTAGDRNGDGMGNQWSNARRQWPVAESETRYVLVYYQPTPDSINPTGAVEKGPFPKFLETHGDGLTGLKGSCLCSVNPNEPICPIP